MGDSGVIALAVVLAALAVGGGFAYHRKLIDARAASLRWPADLSPDGVRRYAISYLRQNGWQILESWPWLRVRVRASKDGEYLNILTHEGNGVSLQTFMRDASEIGMSTEALITVLDYGFGAQSEHVTGSLLNVILMRPAQLGQAVELLQARRKADLEPDTLRPDL